MSKGEEASIHNAIKSASDEYAASVALAPAAVKQVEAAKRATDQALQRIAEIQRTTMATSAEVDVIAGEIVPQLQQHTEQLTNVYALIDKMAEHMSKVKHSVVLMDKRLEAAEAANAGSLTKTWNMFVGNKQPEVPQEAVEIVAVDDFFASLLAKS